MSTIKNIARRSFLISSVAVIGGVVFGVYKYKKSYPNPLLKDLPKGASAITPYVRIDAHGVTIITPRAEMGQGIHTTLAALVAEELDIAWDSIRVEHGAPGEVPSADPKATRKTLCAAKGASKSFPFCSLVHCVQDGPTTTNLD